MTNLATDVENIVSTAGADLTKLEAGYTAEKNKIVTALQTHIATHQKQAAQHNAEIAAAQQLINQAIPSATPAQAQAAAFVLTSKSSWVASAVGFLGKNWRYLVIGLIIAGIFVACHTGLVKVP